MGIIQKFRQARKERKEAKQKAMEAIPKVCGNCKFYQEVGCNGVAGVCCHPKGSHLVQTKQIQVNTAKPMVVKTQLAVMPHFHCGMNCFALR